MRPEVRGPAATILFFIAGFFITLEAFIALALMHGGRSLAAQALILPRFVALAVGFLALASLVWPGNRPLVLGRTILIAALFATWPAATVYGMMPNPADLTWKLGLINLAAVVAIGLLLYVRGGGGPPKWLAEAWRRGSVFVQASLPGARR